MEGILIKASDSKLELCGYNTELGITTVIPATVTNNGTLVLNARLLTEIVRKLPGDVLEIFLEDNLNTTVTCGKSNFELIGIDAEEFPTLPLVENARAMEISVDMLRNMIRQTIFSISNNESNKILTGELFEINGDEFKIASLDLHRVSIRKIQLKESYEDRKAVIPGKTLSEVSKILTGGMDDNVDIFFTKNHVLFELENTIIISRLIEGNFYNINQMLTNDYETKVSVNKRELLECIERATLLLREAENKPVIMNVKNGEIKMEMTTKIGSMDENIIIEKEGKDLRIAFDPKFLIDVLRVIDEEEVNLYLFNAKAPCFIRDDNSYIYLILPVNLIE